MGQQAELAIMRTALLSGRLETHAYIINAAANRKIDIGKHTLHGNLVRMQALLPEQRMSKKESEREKKANILFSPLNNDRVGVRSVL